MVHLRTISMPVAAVTNQPIDEELQRIFDFIIQYIRFLMERKME